MPVDEKVIDDALDLSKLSLPASLPVVRLEAQDYTDSLGEPSLRILAVLDESVDVEHFSGDDVGQFKRAIRDSLRSHGITVFPYVFLAKQSELDEPGGEEP